MRIKWHYFCDDNSVLQEVLRQHSIQFDVLPGYQDELLLVPSHLVFDIFEDSPFFPIIRQQIPDGAVSSPSLCFTDNELDAAQWLTVRGKSMQIEIDNASDAFYCEEYIDENCARHRYRTGRSFFLRKPVKWDRRHYFYCSYDLGEDYLFCCDMARDLLAEYHCEIQYEPVYSAKTKQPIPDLSFLNLTQVIPGKKIRWERGATELVCPQCGRKQIDYSGDFQLHALESTLNTMGNFFRTEAIFGSGNFLSPINVITQKLYQGLKRKSMIRNLEFTPVVPF